MTCVTNILLPIIGSYRSQVSRLQRAFHFAGGVETAAKLVEYYHEVGYDHLIPAYAKYEWTWVQYYNVDVYIVIVTTLAVLTYCAIKLCCCVCKRCKRCKRNVKEKTKKE